MAVRGSSSFSKNTWEGSKRNENNKEEGQNNRGKEGWVRRIQYEERSVGQAKASL